MMSSSRDRGPSDVLAHRGGDRLMDGSHGDRAGGLLSARRPYLYDQDGLSEWAPHIADAATRLDGTHVLMDNCDPSHRAVNARQLAKLIEGIRG